VARLAAALDRLLGRPDFYDEKSFAGASPSEDISKALAEPEKLSIDELHRRNWQALCFVWPDLIAKPHTDLVPITVWHKAADDQHVKLIATGTTDPFIIYVKVSLLVGFILVSPLIFREMWLFVAAGLYPHERRYVYTFLPFSIGLFLAGAMMAFFVAFPPVLKFLLSFNEFLGIAPEPRISEWLTFVLFLPLAFGIGFQLPLVMLFVHRLGLVSVHTYLVQWRVAVLVILVTATLLCPSPDLYSMLLMAGPMVVLYFGGIALCHYSAKRRPKALGGE
jgi:sec-independent protein translocase protein TatC